MHVVHEARGVDELAAGKAPGVGGVVVALRIGRADEPFGGLDEPLPKADPVRRLPPLRDLVELQAPDLQGISEGPVGLRRLQRADLHEQGSVDAHLRPVDQHERRCGRRPAVLIVVDLRLLAVLPERLYKPRLPRPLSAEASPELRVVHPGPARRHDLGDADDVARPQRSDRRRSARGPRADSHPRPVDAAVDARHVGPGATSRHEGVGAGAAFLQCRRGLLLPDPRGELQGVPGPHAQAPHVALVHAQDGVHVAEALPSQRRRVLVEPALEEEPLEAGLDRKRPRRLLCPVCLRWRLPAGEGLEAGPPELGFEGGDPLAESLELGPLVGAERGVFSLQSGTALAERRGEATPRHRGPLAEFGATVRRGLGG
mmetsp:Transcript_34553/g.107590  ORF Transcript_34553/g.107590 Transcript_34553/m.107590 type:complete len:372 (-) Transcript_34553:22-1137(-)